MATCSAVTPPAAVGELATVGCRFDVASPAEVRAALYAGATPDTLVYSNPVKRRDHIAEAVQYRRALSGTPS